MRVSEFIEDFTLIYSQQFKAPQPPAEFLGWATSGLALLLALVIFVLQTKEGQALFGEKSTYLCASIGTVAVSSIMLVGVYLSIRARSVCKKTATAAWNTFGQITDETPTENISGILAVACSGNLEKNTQVLLARHVEQYLCELKAQKGLFPTTTKQPPSQFTFSLIHLAVK